MSKAQSENPNATTTAPEHSPASAETPLAADVASPAATAADTEVPADIGGESKSPRGQPHARSTSSKSARGASKKSAGSAAPAGAPRSLAEQLLAPVLLPQVPLDRRLLPAPLLGALDAAGLGTRDLLPGAAFVALAAIGAVAGPGVQCEPVDGMPGNSGTLSLRIALLAPDRRSPLVPPPILAAAYAAENEALDAHYEVVQRDAEQRRLAADRRRLYAQATRAAAALGIEPPPPLPEAVPAKPAARPRIVVADGAGAAVRLAAAGGTGVMVVDERRMTSMAGVGDFFDEPTDALLNAAAAGRQIPITDPIGGRVVMRTFPAAVIGVLSITDCASLHHAGPAQLLATAFVPAAPTPAVGDSAALVVLMRRVRSMGDNVTPLRLPAQDDALATATAAWAALAAATKPPLSEHLGTMPDLTRRLAIALHLAAAAGSGDGGPAREVPLATVKRATAIIDTVVVPVAQALLGPISTSQTERDARRVIAHLRETTSAAHRLFERRVLVRSWLHSMKAPRLDAALDLLQQVGLLVALDQGAGGQRFEVATAVLDAV